MIARTRHQFLNLARRASRNIDKHVRHGHDDLRLLLLRSGQQRHEAQQQRGRDQQHRLRPLQKDPRDPDDKALRFAWFELIHSCL